MPDKRTHAGQLNVVTGETGNTFDPVLDAAIRADEHARARFIVEAALQLINGPGHREPIVAVEIAATMLKNAECLAVIDGAKR